MSFSTSTSSSVSEINVTPLIDVLLVLLIIFMVIVPVMPRGLDTAIPQVRSKGEPPTAPLVLHIISGVAGAPVRYELNAHALEFAELRSELQRVYATRQDRTMFVQADRALPYGPVASAIGEAHAAGATTVAFMDPQRP